VGQKILRHGHTGKSSSSLAFAQVDPDVKGGKPSHKAGDGIAVLNRPSDVAFSS
jgi:hypothetical protein